MIDLDKLEAQYSGKGFPVPPCRFCGADLEIAFREHNGYEEWHCSNVPSHFHLSRNSGTDRNVLAAVAEIRERRKDERCYQKIIRQAITLLEDAEIDEAIELLAACEDTDG